MEDGWLMHGVVAIYSRLGYVMRAFLAISSRNVTYEILFVSFFEQVFQLFLLILHLIMRQGPDAVRHAFAAGKGITN